MPHFPKLWRGSRRRRAAAAEHRHLAFESLQESLERLAELDERVEVLRLRYQPWKSVTTVATGEFAAVPGPVTGPSPTPPARRGV